MSGISKSYCPESSKIAADLDFLLGFENLLSSASKSILRSFLSEYYIIELIPSSVCEGDSPNAYILRGVMLPGVSGRAKMGDYRWGEEYWSRGCGKLALSAVFGFNVAIRGRSTMRSKPSTWFFICCMYTSL